MKNISPCIHSDHYFLSPGTARSILEICKPLNKFAINYFTFIRVHENGNRVFLSTHPSVIQNYFKNKVYLIGNGDRKPSDYKSQIIFWSTSLKQEVYDMTTKPLGFDHGMTIIETGNGYCDFYGMATQKENYYIYNTYISNIDKIKKFTSYFKDNAGEMIKKANKVCINLPFHNDKLIFLNNSNDCYSESIIPNNNLNKYNLSKRQQECAEWVMKGKSIKQIAEYLQLSHRTIEDHITILKNKFECRNKSELIIKLVNATYNSI